MLNNVLNKINKYINSFYAILLLQEQYFQYRMEVLFQIIVLINKYTVTYICANFLKAEDAMSEAMKETAKEASKLRRSDFEK